MLPLAQKRPGDGDLVDGSLRTLNDLESGRHLEDIAGRSVQASSTTPTRSAPGDTHELNLVPQSVHRRDSSQQKSLINPLLHRTTCVSVRRWGHAFRRDLARVSLRKRLRLEAIGSNAGENAYSKRGICVRGTCVCARPLERPVDPQLKMVPAGRLGSWHLPRGQTVEELAHKLNRTNARYVVLPTAVQVGAKDGRKAILISDDDIPKISRLLTLAPFGEPSRFIRPRACPASPIDNIGATLPMRRTWRC